MLAELSPELKQEIISKLQSDNKQLDLQILAIKNELCRIHVQYEEDMKRLQTMHSFKIPFFQKDRSLSYSLSESCLSKSQS